MPLEYYSLYKNHPEGRWIISKEDCERLQKIVRENGCKTILDLGSGIGASTYALAEATSGKVWAVEQNKKCHKVAKELLPHDLLSKVEFLHEEPIIVKVDGIPFERFSAFIKLPGQEWDLIVIDGPGPFLVGPHLAELPNGDIFGIFYKIKKDCKIYVDNRLATVLLMRRYLYPYLRLLEQGSGDSFYTVFERNDVEFVGFMDAKLSILRLEGYFND